jgi:outer membrane protein insertion porin family
MSQGHRKSISERSTIMARKRLKGREPVQTSWRTPARCSTHVGRLASSASAVVAVLAALISVCFLGAVAAQQPAMLPPPSQATPAAPRDFANELNQMPDLLEEWKTLPDSPANEPITVNSDEPITDVQIEGNTSIPAPAILKYVHVRRNTLVGNSATTIQADIRSLFNTRWFFTVEATFKRSAQGGVILVYQVVERPVLKSVQYVGNKKIKARYLMALTGLQEGGAFSVTANKESVRRIREYYVEKGYRFAEVTLVKGGESTDRDVIFQITEGPKVRVQSIKFNGNENFSDALLKTKMTSKPAILRIFQGKFDPAKVPQDVAGVKQYYHALGYFDVQVAERVEYSDDKGDVTLVFDINEGPRYKIRNIEIAGNKVFDEQTLRSGFKIAQNQEFFLKDVQADLKTVRTRYDEQGRLFAKIDAVPVFLTEKGVVDLRYQIDEDKIYRIGRINVNIEGAAPHTRETVALNQLLFSPGELANPEYIRLSKARLERSPIWEKGAEGATLNLRPTEQPELYAYNPAAAGDYFRGQSPAFDPVWPEVPVSRQGVAPTAMHVPTVDRTLRDANVTPASHTMPIQAMPSQMVPTGSAARLDDFLNQDFGSEATKNPYTSEKFPTEPSLINHRETAPEAMFNQDGLPTVEPEDFVVQNTNSMVIRGQGPDAFQAPNPVFTQSPNGDPFSGSLMNPEPPGFVDVDINVSEARTGRLQFSVGVNSDSGVIGSIVLEEQNFDITNVPTSMADLTSGSAFRGNGENFRIEAVPGDQVSRYLVSWSNPYFLNTDYSLGVSGFYYNRFFDDWRENRLGGRISVGKLLTKKLSLSTALRLEKVDIGNERQPTPEILAESVGSNFLSTVKTSLSWDTRDSSLMPSEGTYLEGSIEQAFAEYSYTKLEGAAQQFFTVYSRPDGEGKHILAFRGSLGWTADSTPIFERFYAGGYQTFRGYSFRGVSPIEQNVRVGGTWMALGSVEYSAPVTVSENVRLVAFTDFGTVEENVSFDHFRMTAGGGVRFLIPGMGPVPISLDWAVPIVSQDFDDEQLFQFYIGFTR